MVSADAQWHLKRRATVLGEHKAHVESFSGPFYPSAALIMLLVLVQWCLWALVQHHLHSWLLIGVAAFVNANTMLYMLTTFIHENSHGLVLGWKWRVLVAGMIESGFISFGEQWEYTVVHYAMHHPALNDGVKDSECPADGHVASLPKGWWGRVIPFVELLPLGSLLTINMSNNAQHAAMAKYDMARPRAALIAVSVAVIGTLLHLRWFQALVFAVWSTTLYSSRWSISLHGQSIAEHFKRGDGRERGKGGPPTTSTYYWFENVIGFNTGFHDEHHTFPNVSWFHLPKLRTLAPEVFCNEQPRRYLGLWFEWACSGFDTELFRMCH